MRSTHCFLSGTLTGVTRALRITPGAILIIDTQGHVLPQAGQENNRTSLVDSSFALSLPHPVSALSE